MATGPDSDAERDKGEQPIRIIFDDEEKSPAPSSPSPEKPEAGTPPPATPPAPESHDEPEGSFMDVVTNISEAFTFPFAGDGKYVVTGGVLAILIVFGSWYLPIVGPYLTIPCLMIYCISQVLFFAFFVKIIRLSGFGDDELPDWPDLTAPWDEVFKPWIFIGLAIVTSYVVPSVVIHLGGGRIGVTVAALLAGSVYFPMQLLALAIIDDLRALNPVLVVRSVLRTQVQYSLCVAFLWSAVITSTLLVTAFFVVVPFRLVGLILVHCFALYFFSVYSRILGKLYRFNARKLEWMKR
ncbi:MAG: hypothetical protein ACYTFG_20375 [Planctomycetota bacterium]|jgi:hypothetical protein